MIALDQGFFLRKRSRRRKIPRYKTITNSDNDRKIDGVKVDIVINNRFIDTFNEFSCNLMKNTLRYLFHSLFTYRCDRIYSRRDIMYNRKLWWAAEIST